MLISPGTTDLTFTPATDAIAGSPILSALTGILPLVLFFILLGVFKLATHWCAVGSLLLAALIAWLGFDMPLGLVGNSALFGAAFGITPILYIVVAAVWLYNLTVSSGRADDVRAVFSAVGKGDMRIQALLVGFSFCGLLEGLAGFGAPVAIVAAMLVSFGISPVKAALVTLVGNSINVCYGAMAIPITTAGSIGGLDGATVASTAATITPIIATFIPLALLFILDGVRGVKQLWLLALVQGFVTAVGQFVAANFISYELTAVFAALLGFAVAALMLMFVNPATPAEWKSAQSTAKPKTADIVLGLMPYWLVVIIFGVAKLWKFGVDLPAALSSTDKLIEWPGLYGSLVNSAGEPVSGAIFKLQTLSNPGTMIVFTALIVSFVYGLSGKSGKYSYSFVRGVKELGHTIYALRMSLLTIALVMSLAYVMNFSGQTVAIGAALAATGAAFGFLSPMLGWIGTAVTGSATSSNALFAAMQSTAAQGAGIDPSLLLSANSIGGGMGKIVSPQALAIAATAINKPGVESELLRKAAPWSAGLLAVLCVLIFLGTQALIPFL